MPCDPARLWLIFGLALLQLTIAVAGSPLFREIYSRVSAQPSAKHLRKRILRDRHQTPVRAEALLPGASCHRRVHRQISNLSVFATQLLVSQIGIALWGFRMFFTGPTHGWLLVSLLAPLSLLYRSEQVLPNERRLTPVILHLLLGLSLCVIVRNGFLLAGSRTLFGWVWFALDSGCLVILQAPTVVCSQLFFIPLPRDVSRCASPSVPLAKAIEVTVS